MGTEREPSGAQGETENLTKGPFTEMGLERANKGQQSIQGGAAVSEKPR